MMQPCVLSIAWLLFKTTENNQIYSRKQALRPFPFLRYFSFSLFKSEETRKHALMMRNFSGYQT